MIEMPTINVVYMYIFVYSLEIKLILSFYDQLIPEYHGATTERGARFRAEVILFTS